MTDAPERIWVDFSDVLYGFEDAIPRVILDIKGCADKAVEEVCGYVNYIRKDLAAPTVKPLKFEEARNGYWNAGFGYQVAHTKGDLWRVRLNGKVICKVIKGFSRAVDWAQDHHRNRILSALEPAPPTQEGD